MAPLRLNFKICSMYDQLSSKNNPFKWKQESDSTCSQFNDKPQTLEPVLSSYKTALGNGKYIWKHNRVMKELVRFIKNYMKSDPTISTQKFNSESGIVYAGTKQTIKHRYEPGKNLLDQVEIREVSAALPGWQYKYVKTISSKGLRPDIVILSRANLKNDRGITINTIWKPDGSKPRV